MDIEQIAISLHAKGSAKRCDQFDVRSHYFELDRIAITIAVSRFVANDIVGFVSEATNVASGCEQQLQRFSLTTTPIERRTAVGTTQRFDVLWSRYDDIVNIGFNKCSRLGVAS